MCFNGWSTGSQTGSARQYKRAISAYLHLLLDSDESVLHYIMYIYQEHVLERLVMVASAVSQPKDAQY